MDLATGQLLLTALNFAPAGTLACNGQHVASATYPGLAELLGASYGGDGKTTFGLPDIAPIQTVAGPPLNWVMVTDGVPLASGMEALVGEVRLLPVTPAASSTFAQTWFPCDGRLLDPSHDAPLFALIGTLFGGDGAKTFALPKLAPVTPSNGPALQYWIANDGLFPPIGGDSTTPAPSSYNFDTYLGMILQLPYVAPSITGHLEGVGLCLGQTMTIAQWAAIFSLLGTRWGGNGTTSFLLPNRPTGADSIAYAMVLNGYYPPSS